MELAIIADEADERGGIDERSYAGTISAASVGIIT
jgi:hypothetical protein